MYGSHVLSTGCGTSEPLICCVTGPRPRPVLIQVGPLSDSSKKSASEPKSSVPLRWSTPIT
ncbi:hypothetical protein E2C01_009861 [Portunus trituberculatus]|uniref:Uncharacterized protein n=1 Tax=Portunus trituberculatus TaxID=210409 RepID=A0A5B7D755_PORTR|nr:hypothetical protein [Portunus trituberculatus]